MNMALEPFSAVQLHRESELLCPGGIAGTLRGWRHFPKLLGALLIGILIRPDPQPPVA